MEPNDTVNFQCLLCKEFLSGKLDSNFSEHMDYHNIKFNQEFIFSTFFLSHKGIEKTVEFMLNYSESEAQTGESVGPSTSRTSSGNRESVTNITTNEEIIVHDILKAEDPSSDDINDTRPRISPAIAKDDSSPKDSREIKTNDGGKIAEEPISDAGETFQANEDSIHNNDQTQDEDLIETWNLWNEDKKRRKQTARKRPNDSNADDDTEEEDDPDFRWESASSKRTISRSSKVKASSEEERVCRCETDFPDEVTKARHMTRFHNKFKCPECPLTFASSSSLRYHMQHSAEKHDPDYGKTQCTTCGARFKSYKFLKEHKTTKHEIGEKRSCPYCSEMIFDVRKHIREAHNVVQECEICGKKVKNLESHFKTVHGNDEDKMFRCATCNKGFILKEKLIAHQLVHSNERPYKCKFGCGFGAKTFGNCKKHEEGKHIQKRLYVNGKPLRKIFNVNNNPRNLEDKDMLICKPTQGPISGRTPPTPEHKTRFKVVKDEILDEVNMKPEEVLDVMIDVFPSRKTELFPQTKEEPLDMELEVDHDDINDYEPVI